MTKRTYDVFVSYRSVDKRLALKLADRLRKAGLRVWIDKQKIAGGEYFDEKIDEALCRSRTVAVLVGPGGIGPWQRREIARAAEDSGTRLVPVLLPKVKRSARLPLALAGLHRIDLTDGIDKVGVGDLVAAIRNKPAVAAKASQTTSLRRTADKPRRKRRAGTAGSTTIQAINGIAVGENVGGTLVVGNGNQVQTRSSRDW